MKKKITILLLIIASIVNAQETKKVLFIGNSITYYNQMPQTFEAIANNKGDATQVTMYAPGGTGFVNHVNDANVYAKFREQVWDFVVLQPGSGESAGISFPIAQTLTRAQRLQDSIIKYSPCAKILYYEISNGVHGSTAANLEAYNNSMTAIKANIEFLADGSELFFAPVGEAFRTKWNNDQTDLLWVSTNNIHPNAKGSYLAACVFYASIFQKNAEGTTVTNNLTQTEATELQILADNTVLDNLSDWRINTWNQFTNFDFQIANNQVTFTNLSQNIDSVEWSFGDGNTSTQNNPIHDYIAVGDFEVTLTTHKNTCNEILTKTVSVTTLSISDFNLEKSLQLYPNPVKETLYIESPIDIDAITIWNLNGVRVFYKKSPNIIDVSLFTTGIYLVKITTKNSSVIKRIVKI